MFANADGKRGWHEYQNLKDVPELELGLGAFAAVWAGRDGNVLITMQEPGDDFSAFTDYCFDKSGRLLQLRFELRTAWGWGYRQEGPIVKGALAARTSEYFSTETEKPIAASPDYADNVDGAIKPHLYLQESQLPFSKLISK